MLWTLAIIFALLWLVGLITSHTFGGLIYILLVAAMIVMVIQVVRGRRLST